MWKPMPGFVLVEKVGTEETFQGSAIIVPIQARDRFSRWQYAVVADGGPLGPNPLAEKPQKPGTQTHFAVGDWIITPPRKALQIDETYLILLERDIWAKVS